jgi:hypothetical protein
MSDEYPKCSTCGAELCASLWQSTSRAGVFCALCVPGAPMPPLRPLRLPHGDELRIHLRDYSTLREEDPGPLVRELHASIVRSAALHQLANAYAERILSLPPAKPLTRRQRAVLALQEAKDRVGMAWRALTRGDLVKPEDL